MAFDFDGATARLIARHLAIQFRLGRRIDNGTIKGEVDTSKLAGIDGGFDGQTATKGGVFTVGIGDDHIVGSHGKSRYVQANGVFV